MAMNWFSQKATDTMSDPSAFSGIKNIDDLKKMLGLSTSAKDIYNPLKLQLTNQTARGKADAALRGGRNATPGMNFSRIESQGYDQMLRLLGMEAQTSVDMERFAGSNLLNVFGQQDDWRTKKAGTFLNAGGLDLNWQKQMRKPSFLAQFTSLLNGLGKVALPFVVPGASKTVIDSFLGGDQKDGEEGQDLEEGSVFNG